MQRFPRSYTRLSKQDLIAKLYAYTNVDEVFGCWVWNRCLNNMGYGKICVGNYAIELAHRVSYELHVGPIPANMFVLHKCDNPACCNPEHLFVGTQADNMRDASRKGRVSRKGLMGIEHGRAQLTEADVRHIRQSPISCGKLATRYGLSATQIYRIKKRQLWRHLED